MTTLGLRQLNRASLARQLLLERAELPVEKAVERLAGLQAQAPNAPYVGLWSRVAAFRHDELATALLQRRLVRAGLLRGTIHLVTAADTIAWGPLTRPVFERGLRSNFGKRLVGVDLAELVTDSLAALAQGPRTRAELAAALSKKWPDNDRMALAYAATSLIPLVQVPPRGIWGDNAQATWTTTDEWLGSGPAGTVAGLISRFLAAFGPAGVRDMQTWSGLTRLREVVATMDLRTYTDEQGQQLYDLPDAALPDPETPAPPRFLPEYDNLLLGYAHRTRVAANHRAVPLPPGLGGTCGSLLVDGFWRAEWRIDRTGDTATLVVEPFEPIGDVTEEALALLRFAAADAQRHEVRVR